MLHISHSKQKYWATEGLAVQTYCKKQHEPSSQSTHVPTLTTGHQLRLETEPMRLQTQAGGMCFNCRVDRLDCCYNSSLTPGEETVSYCNTRLLVSACTRCPVTTPAGSCRCSFTLKPSDVTRPTGILSRRLQTVPLIRLP